jgi:hypothetical protein
MALWFTQPVTEMNTRRSFGEKSMAGDRDSFIFYFFMGGKKYDIVI